MASTGSSSRPPGDEGAGAHSVVVGITSWNNAPTVEAVSRCVAAGLESLGSAACVVFADGGSSDGTLDAGIAALEGRVTARAVGFDRTAVDPLRAPYHGLPGRPAAIHAVLMAARKQGARACVLLDASITSAAPHWIPGLLDPILAGADYVAPCYQRAAHEGALTRSIVHPVFHTLYGVPVRQPAAGEFACSSRFIDSVIDQRLWQLEGSDTGVDLWLASAAATGGFVLAEVGLGMRSHASRPDAPDLSVTLSQVVGAVFSDVEMRSDVWQRRRAAPAVAVSEHAPAPGSTQADVRHGPLLDGFRLGYANLHDLWAWISPARTVLRVRKLLTQTDDEFRFPDDLWAQLVYDFALAYHARSIPREHVLGALTPLYLAWLAGFLLEVDGAGAAALDRRIEQLCAAFEAQKSHLIAGWRWPERFRA
jgi:glucosylglycerate synthase